MPPSSGFIYLLLREKNEQPRGTLDTGQSKDILLLKEGLMEWLSPVFLLKTENITQFCQAMLSIRQCLSLLQDSDACCFFFWSKVLSLFPVDLFVTLTEPFLPLLIEFQHNLADFETDCPFCSRFFPLPSLISPYHHLFPPRSPNQSHLRFRSNTRSRIHFLYHLYQLY